MIFNEQVLYKDRLGKVSNNADSKVRISEVVHLKDFLVNDLQVNVHEVQETTPLEDQENVVPEVNRSTLATKLRSLPKLLDRHKGTPFHLTIFCLLTKVNQRVIKKQCKLMNQLSGS